MGATWSDLLAQMGDRCVVVPLRKIFQGSPVLLQGVQEGGALLGLLARVGAHQVHLMARVGDREVGAVRCPMR